jgi:hypothetical protein
MKSYMLLFFILYVIPMLVKVMYTMCCKHLVPIEHVFKISLWLWHFGLYFDKTWNFGAQSKVFMDNFIIHFYCQLFEFSSNIFPKFQLVGQSIIIITLISQPSFHSSFVLNFSSFQVFIFNKKFL